MRGRVPMRKMIVSNGSSYEIPYRNTGVKGDLCTDNELLYPKWATALLAYGTLWRSIVLSSTKLQNVRG